MLNQELFSQGRINQMPYEMSSEPKEAISPFIEYYPYRRYY